MTFTATQALTSKFSSNGAAFAVFLVASFAAIAAVCALYMIKSALGINVFAGHLPVLHALLYPIVRG